MLFAPGYYLAYDIGMSRPASVTSEDILVKAYPAEGPAVFGFLPAGSGKVVEQYLCPIGH